MQEPGSWQCHGATIPRVLASTDSEPCATRLPSPIWLGGALIGYSASTAGLREEFNAQSHRDGALAARAAIASSQHRGGTSRSAKPENADTRVTRTADVDRPERKHGQARIHRGGSSEYWHYRLGATRWLHYQYVNAGYPASRYEGEVYYTTFPGDYCCGYRRHWPWMGRYHHGHRYWPWMGHRRHHHHW